MKLAMVVAALIAGLCVAATARAAEPPTQTFALIIGANRSIDPELKPLLYADDDAVRYLMLFKSLGARVQLLTRPDANTSRVMPAAVGQARPPQREALAAAVATLAGEVRAARAKGVKTALYFLFAGHGNVDEGRAYLGLEDARLTGADLDREVLRPIGADQTHVIVDACYSYYLARERGPGGRARVVHGFSDSDGGLDRPDVGLLLSTSSARESHEWDGFQAGVFSHEVRSGLYGAADIDGDGQIDYREIGAFIVRANAAIPNEQLRPDVFARPPQGGGRLLDLRPGHSFTMLVDAPLAAAHYLVEDAAGNRLVEFHGDPRRPLRLIRPQQMVFLRNVDSGREYLLNGPEREIRIAALTARAPQARARGAAHHAFSLIFTMPFDDGAVAQYAFPVPAAEGPATVVAVSAKAPVPAAPPTRWHARSIAAAATGAVAAAALAASGSYVYSSRQHESQAASTDTQKEAARLNAAIESDQQRARWLGIGGAVAAAGALTLWLWPKSAVAPAVAATAGDGTPAFGVSGRF